MNVAMYDDFVPFSRIRGLDIGISARAEGDRLPKTLPYLNITFRRAVYRC